MSKSAEVWRAARRPAVYIIFMAVGAFLGPRLHGDRLEGAITFGCIPAFASAVYAMERRGRDDER